MFTPSYRKIAEAMAERLARHADCPDHPGDAPDFNCEACKDRSVLTAYQAKRASDVRRYALRHAEVRSFASNNPTLGSYWSSPDYLSPDAIPSSLVPPFPFSPSVRDQISYPDAGEEDLLPCGCPLFAGHTPTCRYFLPRWEPRRDLEVEDFHVQIEDLPPNDLI